MEFVFTVNSPGEVATWLAPTLRAVKRQLPDAITTVFVVPCAFATGAETKVVRAMPEADRVFSPGDYWSVVLGRRNRPLAAKSGGAGALLYLGGDLVHAVWLARRWHLPALAYVERGSRWTRSFREVLVPDEQAKASVLRRGGPEGNVHIVGNLMVDAVGPVSAGHDVVRELGLDAEKPIVAVFPGSRPYEIKLSLPFLLRAVEMVWTDDRDVQCVISLSSFVSSDVLAGAAVPGLDGTRLTVASAGRHWLVTTELGFQAVAVQGRPYDVMQVADIALTLPGSNTAEMAAVGLPMVVALPLNVAEKIPLPGAAQYVEKLPLVGKRWKRTLVHRRAAEMPFVAWPNRKARDQVVPEVRGVLRPEDVALEAVQLLRDGRRRRAIRERLRQVMGPAGAAARVAERLVSAAEAGGLR